MGYRTDTMKMLEKWFESALWNGRFLVVVAVAASMVTATITFYMATVDVVYLVGHMFHYADPSLDIEAREAINSTTITHIVGVVDGYLLAVFMLIFALGLYELFVSDIDEAKVSKASSNLLMIKSLDDLKARLARLILMILIITLFEAALKMKMRTPLDLLYLSGAIALIGAALFLTGKGEAHGKESGGDAGPG